MTITRYFDYSFSFVFARMFDLYRDDQLEVLSYHGKLISNYTDNWCSPGIKFNKIWLNSKPREGRIKYVEDFGELLTALKARYPVIKKS